MKGDDFIGFLKNAFKLMTSRNKDSGDSAKKKTKNSVTKWVLISIGGFIISNIGWIFIILLVMVPLTLSFAVVNEIVDWFEDTALQIKAESWDKLEAWIKGQEKGTEYEDYLVTTYMNIAESLDSKKDGVTEDDVNNKTTAAIGWVYSRIYTATMKATKKMDDNFFLEGENLSTKGLELKNVEDTVIDIYDAKDGKEIDVFELRKKAFGENEVITSFDLQAFDAVGGTLTDMLNLDLKKLKEESINDNEEQILEKLDKSLITSYRENIIRYIAFYGDVINKVFYNSHSKDEEFTSVNQVLKEAGEDFTYDFERRSPFEVLENYMSVILYKPTEEYKKVLTLSNTLKKISEAEGIDYLAKVRATTFTYEEFESFLAFGDLFPMVSKEILESSGCSRKTIKKMVAEMNNIVENYKYSNYRDSTLGEIMNSYKSEFQETYNRKRLEVENTLNEEELKKAMVQKVKDLKLGRTWTVAETYMYYLAEIDSKARAQYYSFKTSLLEGTKNTVPSGTVIKDGDTLKLDTTSPMYKTLDELLNDFGIGKNSSFKYDANGNIIVAGVVGSTNYLEEDSVALKAAILEGYDKLKTKFQDNVQKSVEELRKADVDAAFDEINSLTYELKLLVSKLKSTEIYKSMGDSTASLGLDLIYRKASSKTLDRTTVDSAHKRYTDMVDHSLESFEEENALFQSFYATAIMTANNIEEVETIGSKYNNTISELTDEIFKFIATMKDVINKDMANEGDYYANDSLFTESDISTIYENGTSRKISSLGENNGQLIIYKYTNTLEQAVKKTAQKCYPEVVRKLAGLKSGNFMADGDYFGIHADVLGEYVGNEKYMKGQEMLDAIEKASERFGFSPNILYAFIAQESGFNQDFEGIIVGYGQVSMEYHKRQFKSNPLFGEPMEFYMDETTANQPETAMEWSANYLRNLLDSFNNNILHAISAYNIGPGGHVNLLNYHISTNGLNMTDVEYLESGDTGWLETRLNAPTHGPNGEPILQSTVNARHLEKVCQYLDVEGQDTWVIDRETGTKIWISGSGYTKPSEDGNQSEYFNGKELVKWKEYYTDNGMFEEADRYLDEALMSIPEKVNITGTLSEAILKSFTDYVRLDVIEDEFDLFISKEDLVKIIAKTYYIDTEFKPKDIDESLIASSVYKIGQKYVKIISELMEDSEKDLSFAVYLSCLDDEEYEIELKNIKNFNGTFDKYIKDEYLKDKESLTSSDEVLTRVVQIITGDKKASVDGFFDIKEEGSNSTGVVKDGKRAFYNEWLDSKNMFHQFYNVQLDEKIEKTDDEAEKQKYEDAKLPIYNINWETTTKKPNDSGLIGKLSLFEGDKTLVNNMPIFKKLIENKNNFEAGSKNAPRYIVIHTLSDATLSTTASSRVRHYNSTIDENEVHKSVHYVVDSKETYQLLNINTSAYHIKDNTKGIRNNNSIGIEVVLPDGEFTEKTQLNLVALVKYLVEEYNFNESNIILHNDIDGENCPDSTLKDFRKIWDSVYEKICDKSKYSIEFKEVVSSESIDAVIQEARKHVGKPYILGADGPEAFDCSSFTEWCYFQVTGVKIGENTWAQDERLKDTMFTDLSQLQKGDLIMTANLDHVTLYIGDGKIIHAANESLGVIEQNVYSDLVLAYRPMDYINSVKSQ